MKKYIYIIILVFLFSGSSVFAQKRSQFERKQNSTFKNETFSGKKKKDAGKDAPDPGGGDDDPVPVSGGLYLLAGGLIAYSMLRKKRE